MPVLQTSLTTLMLTSVLMIASAALGAGNGLGCDGDATQDGFVNTDDVLEVITLWGSSDFDLDGDGLCSSCVRDNAERPG